MNTQGPLSHTARALLPPADSYISKSACWVSTAKSASTPPGEHSNTGVNWHTQKILKQPGNVIEHRHTGACARTPTQYKNTQIPCVQCFLLHPKLQEGQLVVCQFQFLRWSAYRDVPDSKKAFLNLLAQVHKWQRECGEGRTVVHCLWVVC